MTSPTADELIRLSTLAAFVGRDIYWRVAEFRADQAKPRLQQRGPAAHIKRYVLLLFVLFLYWQLLGLQILPFQTNLGIQLFGLALVLIGLFVSVSARRALGTNWAHGADYQIKQQHALITTGIYKYIRHPIYIGIFVSAIGAEIVAGSLLFIPLLISAPYPAIKQARREEEILTKQFGNTYTAYMKTSKKFIPFIW